MPPWYDDELEELEALREADRWPDSFGPRLVLVCRCHCVEEAEVEALARQGLDVEEISSRTGAGMGCGGCLRQLRGIVEDVRKVLDGGGGDR